jgi:galactokinase
MKKIVPFLERIYGPAATTVQSQFERYRHVADDFARRFDRRPEVCVSVPGRTELGGNHTDHNHGRVLAAAIDLDVTAVAARRDDMIAMVHSEGYPDPFVVDLKDISIHENEQGTTSAMIRGIAALLKDAGFAVGGVDVRMTSNVPSGSGLSSSAAVEVLFGTIFSALFNDGKIDPKTIAAIGQHAENIYYGKPCGLMDQVASAMGGIVAIDFQEPKAPEIEKIDFDLSGRGFDLVIVDTGGNHLDLTDDYAGIPAEMKTVAGYFGKEALREVPGKQLMDKIGELRKAVGDRAVLRAIHFMDENERVTEQVDALRKGDIERFVHLVSASGNSSIRWLQNVYSTRDVNAQGVTLGLAMTERYLSENGGGACRVHGGGFAGSIQVLLPKSAAGDYVTYIEKVFGPKSARVVKIRSCGACFFNPQEKT